MDTQMHTQMIPLTYTPTLAPSALVIGLGVTGYSIIEFLYPLGWRLTVMDSRLCPPCLDDVQKNYPDVDMFLGDVVSQQFENYDTVITSPGVALESLQSGTPIIGDIELFAQHVDAPVIAITGSNGKSTVTTLVTELLQKGGFQAQAGGNIGYPALNLLNQTTLDFYVLELSSFQLETTRSLSPVSSVVLNITEDHMDRYASFADYAEVKQSIYSKTQNSVVPRDMQEACSQSDAISFGLDAPATNKDFGIVTVEGKKWIAQGDTLLLNTEKLLLSGQHNVLNTMAAFALIDAAGVVINADMIAAAECFQGLSHRCEVVIDREGMQWINDSKATNVGATIAAIKGFAKPMILILGGQSKDADFSPLTQNMENVSQVFVYGKAADQLEQILSSHVAVAKLASLADVVERAGELVSHENLVLFSPACASFDMFQNYQHRGEMFKDLVMRRGS